MVGDVERTVDPLADLEHQYCHSHVLVRYLRYKNYDLLVVVAGPDRSIGRDILDSLEESYYNEIKVRRNAKQNETTMSFEQSYFGNPPGITCSGGCAGIAMGS